MADHSHGHAHAHAGTDRGAVFTGLLAGAILVGAILYGTVLATNSKFAGEKGAEAHAATTK